ncbi:hypothetical protein [Hoeflea sp.]|uniref:hypothetical protein n=1 Tax=Hoeflea sp. TaxID=1940281 RepID=UPI0037484F64
MPDTRGIVDEDELGSWLSDKPLGWAQAIAARNAMRVFPLVFFIKSITDRGTLDPILSVWRANFLSWAACKYPTRDMAVCASNAAIAVRVTTNANDVVSASAAAAKGAAESTRARVTPTAIAAVRATAIAGVRAAEAAVRAHGDVPSYETTGNILWEAVKADCQYLLNGKGDLIEQPLWINDVRGDSHYVANFPIWARKPFDEFADSDLANLTSWKLIVNWYRALLPNGLNLLPRSLFGEKADIVIAMQPDEFWEREPDVVLAAIRDIGSRRSMENEDKLTIAQFIVDYLESVEDTATINEIRAAFVDAEYQVIDKTMRGTLSQLAKTGKIQRVETGVYARNAWLLKRFDEVLETDEFLHDSSEILENLEPQAPAAFRFEWSDEKIFAQPPGTFSPDSETAQDLLDDARRKALSLAERLERSNAEKRVRDSLEGLIAVLADRVPDLRPGLLRSRSRSIEADAMAYAAPSDERELFPDAVAALTDLSETLRDLQGCFPQLREIEAEVMALDIDPAKANEVKAHLDEIVDAVSEHENVVDQSAVYALQTMEGIASEDASPAVKQKRIAEYALVVRNFMSPLARFALDNAFSKAVTQATEEIWAKARPKVIDGVADGMGSMARPATIIAIAYLVHLIINPAAGIATAVAGFGKIDRLLKLVEKWLVKSRDTISEEASGEDAEEDEG